ncbi:kinase-like domain-containing protein [Xylaria arbuscula]|nr:kinase-like domain-containing protein [Xylaria arbuscula]
MRSSTLNVVPRSYEDDILERCDEGQLVEFSLRVLFNVSQSRWHVKVTFRGMLQSSDIQSTWLQRKRDLTQLCHMLELGSLPLLDDTVTEVLLSNTPPDSCKSAYQIDAIHLEPCNMYARVALQLYTILREDPARVRFPLYNHDSRIPTRDVAVVRKKMGLAAGVSLAHLDGHDRLYVYKEIDKPHYLSGDTEALIQEFQNLKTLREVEGIVRLMAVVTSANPYQSTEASQGENTVARGILLEYHSNGTLQDALKTPGTSYPWKRWALQVASSLHKMHQYGITHMDIKPSNIVISANLEAILIDVSGRAYSREWLSPEMRYLEDPLVQDFTSLVLNDIWAFGNLASQMASASSSNSEKDVLMALYSSCTAPPSARPPLHQIVAILNSCAQESSSLHSLQSMSSGLKPPFVRLPKAV